MARRICYHCGKGPMAGATHRHRRGVASKKFQNRAPETKRVLKPNLHRTTIIIKGIKKKILLCTKCLRKLKKAKVGKEAGV